MVEAVRVKAPPVEDIIDQRGLDTPAEETLLKLWQKGRQLEVDARGEDVVDRWLERKLAEVELNRQELEEYALSLGEHLTHIQNEGWATWVAGFEQRAAGLFLAVGATIQQLDRIHDARNSAEARGSTATLSLTAFDFVNALGIRTYDEVIVDHDDWMDELASQSPEIVEASPLLQFFREDFHSLARDAHTSLRNKVVGQAAIDAAVERRKAPAKTEGMGSDTIWLVVRSSLGREVREEDVNAVSGLVEDTLDVPARDVFCTSNPDLGLINCFIRFSDDAMPVSKLNIFWEDLRKAFNRSDKRGAFADFNVVDEAVVEQKIPGVTGPRAQEV